MKAPKEMKETKSPKVLVSVDMEGVSGIVHTSEVNPDRYDYERGRALMTAEANAVVAGVLDAEPAADVLVADAHGPFRNLLPEQMDRRARLVRGKPRPLGMVAGLDGDIDAVLLIGYHARAGAGPGVIAHTMSGEVLDVRVDGRSLGEIGLNGALAGHFGVPVVMLSGDDVACAEFDELVPSAVGVAVKEAVAGSAAVTLHPEEARERLRAAAAEAVGRRAHIPPLVLDGPLTVEVDMLSPFSVDLALLVPGVSRAEGGRTVVFTAADFAEAHRLVLLLVQLASIKPG
ncbi:M55 family metallopeptidase [[Kitasatospora] papulosa]|uniref:M55 family metallopeptidase n=1 Tax=Streptomyces TaxID=1883 RepID=UPI002E77F1A8|nr:M55 family metallopeptidase [Streptomyces sp. JV181]MEE1777149.1 M55 family metallopeptidase [Streptomyces sp. JV181]